MTMTVDKRDYIIPSVHLAEVFHASYKDRGALAASVEHIVQDGFYRSVELPIIENKGDRRRICEAFLVPGCRVGNVIVWSGLYAAEHELDINSCDEAIRKKSVDTLKRLIEEACECGAGNFGVVSGRDTGILERSCAFRALMKSLTELTEFAKEHKQNLIFEPVERFSGRNALLGNTEDTLQLLELLKPQLPTLYCCYDTAHTALNRELLTAALVNMQNYIGNIHLSNAVLDLEDPLYGDNHIAPGLPGFLTVKAAEKLLLKAWELNLNRKNGMIVCTELRQRDDTPKTQKFDAYVAATDFLKQLMLEFVLEAK